jgi:thiamine-phosphate diphosphorylase
VTAGPRSRPCPRLVAVSDEARLARADAMERIAALAGAGCPAILLRPGSMGGRELYNLVCKAVELCHAAAAELWVGDRADVAVAAGADGVQLPARGLSLAGARRVAGDRPRLGRSVHAPEEAARAAGEGADHVIVGAVFATASHPGGKPGGAALIAGARAAMEAAGRSVPILAIGGMTPETAPRALAAGAWGVAAISALWDAFDPAAAVRDFLAALGDEAPPA